jgi:triosephosphate isomerase
MKKFIVANWKLNPITAKEAIKLAGQINRKPKNKVVLCPPHVFLSSIKYPNLGAQDCFWEEKGAHTGQVSPLQLKSMKVKYCIVGHSERRAIGETDPQINLKIRALLEHKIIPILCVGYGTTANEDDMEVTDVLKLQLQTDLAGIDASGVVVAYEPVWAIGTGKTPTPDHADRIALFIKTRFHVNTVLYGGSSNIFNAAGFLAQQQIDGLLVGGDSLIPAHFNQIINI